MRGLFRVDQQSHAGRERGWGSCGERGQKLGSRWVGQPSQEVAPFLSIRIHAPSTDERWNRMRDETRIEYVPRVSPPSACVVPLSCPSMCSFASSICRWRRREEARREGLSPMYHCVDMTRDVPGIYRGCRFASDGYNSENSAVATSRRRAVAQKEKKTRRA